MVRYKLMYKEKGKKKYYNFGPTVHSTANPRYSKIDSMAKAKSVKREMQREPDYKGRTWKIKQKYKKRTIKKRR